jgi:hypothetical protein
MAKDTTTFTLRLTTTQQDRVKELADRFEVGEAQVIRWGVDALLRYVDRHGGQLHLPIDFDKFWQEVEASAPRLALAAESPTSYKAKRMAK